MSLDERVSNLIKQIYCAGSDQHAWEDIGEEVIRQVGAHRCFTTLVDLQDREYDAWRFHGPEDTFLATALSEVQDVYQMDPSLVWASANPDARFCDSSRTVPPDDYLNHPYVKWSTARLGVTHWYVGYTPVEYNLSYSFSVLFSEANGPGTPRQIQLFRMLFEHLTCATRLHRRPFNPQSTRALILLDRTGQVRELSIGAQCLLMTSDGFAITGGRIELGSRSDQPKLDAAIARAASAIETGEAASAVKAARPSGRRPWIFTIRPMLHSFGAFGKLCSEVLVELHDGSPKIRSLELLQSLYDLTARELQVVRLLADGHSIESLAHELRISANTVRTHLRAIFTKTSTTRQSELMQLCAGLGTR